MRTMMPNWRFLANSCFLRARGVTYDDDSTNFLRIHENSFNNNEKATLKTRKWYEQFDSNVTSYELLRILTLLFFFFKPEFTFP